MADDPTLSADLQSWVPVPDDSPFPIQNLPYGVFSVEDGPPRLGVAIGDHVLDLRAVAELGIAESSLHDVFAHPSLDRLLGGDRALWRRAREAISGLLAAENPTLQAIDADRLLSARAEIRMHLPFTVGDFADFYSGLEHAMTMGRMYRPEGDPLLPQWRHLPVAYHGRSSTVALSGTDVRRPAGLVTGAGAEAAPRHALCEQLDYEVELGCVLGDANELGAPVRIDRASDHIFGFVILNDWSARDIQRYEYVPFGPFAGKSFLTSISPWVVTTDALAPWRVPGPRQEPPVAPYMRTDEPWNFVVALTTRLQTAQQRDRGLPPTQLARTTAERLYWSCAQQLAHVSVNGATVGPGDLLGSGTISGWEEDEKGCLAERTLAGRHPVELDSGEQRSFLEDGDALCISAACEPAAAVLPVRHRVGFGDVHGMVAPGSLKVPMSAARVASAH